MTSVQWYYHYTSTAGGNAIRTEEVVRSQNSVQLSTLKPEDHTRDDILRSIYGNKIPPECKNRADNVVYISESMVDASKLFEITPTLYQYTGEIKVNASDIRDKPACANQGSSWGSRSSNSSSGWSGSVTSQNCPQVLYYYANEYDADAIQSSRNILPAAGIIYLTTMKPEDYYRDEILRIIYGENYDRLRYAAFADWCVKVDASELDGNQLKQVNSKVYEYTDSIRVDASDVMDKPRCKKAQRSADQEQFYHYTNTAGAHAIKAAGYLKKSGASGPFGVGVYMTNLKPTDFFRDDILKNNYGGINSAFKGRADWVVRINRSDLVEGKLKPVDANVTGDGGRKIYVYEDVVNVNSSDVYDKPKCYRAK